jgi:hypothetical protein
MRKAARRTLLLTRRHWNRAVDQFPHWPKATLYVKYNLDHRRAAAFPLDSMGIIAGNAAKALVQRTQAPDAIAGQTILAALNVVAQRHIDVLVPQGGDHPRYGVVRPISCYLLTIATTGERKSGCEGLALVPHREYERAQQKKYKEELDTWKASYARYEAQRKAISNDKDLSEDQFKADVAALGPAPEQPQDPTFLFDNPTWPGMIKKLRHNVRDVGLFSDEGGKYLGGFSMKDEQRLATTANMNAAWDAKPVQRILAGKEPFTLYGVRLAMHLMVQPSM